MPEIDETEPEPIELRRLDMHGLWRVLLWGSTAAMALAVVAGTAFSDFGAERIKQVVASLIEPVETKLALTPAPTVAPQQLAELEKQTRQLTQTVRELTADRDRVKERLAVLQQSLDDITGAVKRQTATQTTTQTQAATQTTSQPATQTAQTTPTTQPPATTQKLAQDAAPPAAKEPPKQTAAVTPPPVVGPPQTVAAIPSPQLPATTATAEPPIATASTPPVIEASPPIDGPIPLPPSRAAALEKPDDHAVRQIGIEIGGAPSIEALRAHWSSVKANIGPDIVGLSPTYTIRQKATGGAEYRLVLGPVPNSAAAIRLCAKLATSRITCRAGTFNVQKLADHSAPALEQRTADRLPAMGRDAIMSR
jgi:hypothetical protein